MEEPSLASSVNGAGSLPEGTTQVQGPPVILVPNFDRMPDELKGMKNWVVWKYMPPKSAGSKWRKVPFQANGTPAKTTDPSTWSGFDECRTAYHQGGWSGIGFVFDGKPDQDGLVFAGVDFDSPTCEGEIAIETAEWVDRLGSYVETSVSGKGVHVILKAEPLPSGISHGGIELYTSKRFFVMTGNTPANASLPIKAAPAEFAALAAELKGRTGGSASANDNDPSGNGLQCRVPEWAKNSRPASGFTNLRHDSLADGLEANIDEVRSAVSAIPPSAIEAEPEWMKLARGLAHEAALHPEGAEQLWEILDAASRQAPGYDQDDNRQRWLRYIDEALDHDTPITISTIFHMADEHGWPGWSPSLTPTTSAPPMWSANELKLSFANIPHRRWLYGTYLIRGEITVLAAPGGAGKTALATGIAVEIATGIEVLDEKMFGSELKVLLINGEDSGTEIERRVLAFCLAYANKIPTQAPDRLYVVGSTDPRVQRLSFLKTTGKNFSTLDRGGFEVLEAALEAIRPDVFIVDPLVAFCGGGDMNDNALMALVIRELKRLATKFDCAGLIVHHTRKGPDDGSADAISGAAAIVNLARRAIMPVLMTDGDAKFLGVLPSERFRYFKLVDAKSNLAPRSADSPWYRLHSVELPNPEPPIYPHGDNVQAVERVKPSSLASAASTADDPKTQDAILDVVERGKMIDGESYPYSPSMAGAKNIRSLLDDAMAAVADATAPRQWHPGDLKAVTERTIAKLKEVGVLVDAEIP